MNRRILLPIVVLVLVTLACAAPASDKATPTLPPEPTVEVLPTKAPEPTNTPEPTKAPEPTAVPTEKPVEEPTEDSPDLPTSAPVSDEPPAYYLEEFGGDLGNYTYFTNYGDDDGYELYSDDDKLIFDIASDNTAAYVTYDPWVYEDVYTEVAIENRGANTMDVSLVCRFSEDGWYEFAIQSNGLWYIWRYDSDSEDYTMLYNGGSQNINMGKAQNIYGAECDGQDLTFCINGKKAFSVRDDTHREGQVGFGVTSYDDVPVKVEFEYFFIDEP